MSCGPPFASGVGPHFKLSAALGFDLGLSWPSAEFTATCRAKRRSSTASSSTAPSPSLHLGVSGTALSPKRAFRGHRLFVVLFFAICTPKCCVSLVGVPLKLCEHHTSRSDHKNWYQSIEDAPKWVSSRPLQFNRGLLVRKTDPRLHGALWIVKVTKAQSEPDRI